MGVIDLFKCCLAAPKALVRGQVELSPAWSQGSGSFHHKATCCTGFSCSKKEIAGSALFARFHFRFPH